MIIYGKWEVLSSNLINLLDLLDIDIKWEDQRISSDCIGVVIIMNRNTTFDIFIIIMYCMHCMYIGLFIIPYS